MKRRRVLIFSILVFIASVEFLLLRRRRLSNGSDIQEGYEMQKTSGIGISGYNSEQKERHVDRSNVSNESTLEFQLKTVLPIKNSTTTTTVNANRNAFISDQPFSDLLTSRTSTARYLFPVQFWEGGPNWNYLSFRRLVAYAIKHNRTLVMIPFHNHHVQGWEKGWRSLEETLDVGKLSEIVSMVTPESYKEDCGDKVDLLVQFSVTEMTDVLRKFHRTQYERTREDFEDLWEIHLPDTRGNRRNPKEVARQLGEADNVRCLGINGPLLIKELLIENESYVLKVVDNFFLRAEYIRKMGDKIKSAVCGGRPYVAIHWRNRTGESCEFNSLFRSKEQCFRNLRLLSSVSRMIAEAVGRFMKTRGIECVYVAAPPRRQEFIERLRDVVPCVYTASFMTSRKSSDFRRLEDDNYILSLVEQEVCTGAEVFLSCGRSNWSDFVRVGRELVGSEVYYLGDLPGVPKEIYRFI
ncbi:uncharacterized protein [Ptychodera flava]|uniref:uncharacterized protein n=1 Tax=Ptychodera flava TaxID=63121 RepID=UPI003969C985